MRTFEINKIHIMDFCQISVLILSEFEGKLFFFLIRKPLTSILPEIIRKPMVS